MGIEDHTLIAGSGKWTGQGTYVDLLKVQEFSMQQSLESIRDEER